MFDLLIKFIRDQYKNQSEFIPLHAPTFKGRERDFVIDTIDSTFVSSIGKYVDRFEREISFYVGSPSAVATVNGTAALHVALKLIGLKSSELVITQPISFVATCNAIAYCQADPIFVDVDRQTLGMSPKSLEAWLQENAEVGDDGLCREKTGGKIIRACLPMHTFGHPVDIETISKICNDWNLYLIEDAAESLGSLFRGRHTGTFGQIGILSFNGNKIMTTGGGGMVLASEEMCIQAKHLTTTAKLPHRYEYLHDEIGFNYRMPNLNAALGCAQLEQLEYFIAAKRELARRYADYFRNMDLEFIDEPSGSRSNFWLNGVICESRDQRDRLLAVSNNNGVMTRPIWNLINRLPMYSHCIRGELTNAEWLQDRVVNLPSSVLPELHDD